MEDSAEISSEALKFRIPAGMVVSGPSGAGKTSLVRQLIGNREKMFDPAPADVLYCYGHHYDDFVRQLEQMDGVTTHRGVPSDEFLTSRPRPLLLVLDDLMGVASQDFLSELYTKRNHHENIFTIFCTQDAFDKRLKVARDNSQYLLLCRAPNAMRSIRTLGAQLFPRQLPYFLDSFAQATQSQFGYILVDMHAASDQRLRLRTQIFPDQVGIIFIPQV